MRYNKSKQHQFITQIKKKELKGYVEDLSPDIEKAVDDNFLKMLE